jgi:methyltransferase
MTEQERAAKARRMEQLIRTYVEGGCEADAEKMMSCLTPDVVHYFPPDMYDGPWRSAAKIAEKWQAAVANFGSYWTMDQVVVSPDTNQAVGEWTHFKTKQGTVLRGVEWYVFDDDTGLIKELRAYYASPQDPKLKKLELGGLDYEGRGYPLAPPPGARD